MTWRLLLVSSLILFGASAHAMEEKQSCDRRYVKTTDAVKRVSYPIVLQTKPGQKISHDDNNSKPRLPLLYEYAEVCVESKSADGRWSRVSVADQRHHQGWIETVAISTDADEKTRAERFRIGRTESIHGEELAFRNGDLAVLINPVGDGSTLPKGRISVVSSEDTTMGDAEGPGAYMSGKEVKFDKGDGIIVSSLRLAKEPKTAEWETCEPPTLSVAYDEAEKLLKELKDESSRKAKLPVAKVCSFKFRGISIEIEYRAIGIELRKDSTQYEMETRVRIDGKEQVLPGNEWQRMLWAGDLDGDNGVDLIFTLGPNYNQGDTLRLFMSDQKGKLKFVSSYTTYGC